MSIYLLSPLSEYKYSLGIPGQGIHFHVFGIAIMDVIFTLLAAGPISYVLDASFIQVCVILFILAIILHLIFGVPTAMMTTLGLVKPNSFEQNPYRYIRKKIE